VFALVVRFDLLDPGAAERFDALVADLLPQIAAHEPGTLAYVVHAVVDAPLSRLFYECYRDRAAFEEHESQPHTRHFLDARETVLAGRRVEFLTPTGSADR
jgi:quinol monooxygenase YgiN